MDRPIFDEILILQQVKSPGLCVHSFDPMEDPPNKRPTRSFSSENCEADRWTANEIKLSPQPAGNVTLCVSRDYCNSLGVVDGMNGIPPQRPVSSYLIQDVVVERHLSAMF